MFNMKRIKSLQGTVIEIENQLKDSKELTNFMEGKIQEFTDIMTASPALFGTTGDYSSYNDAVASIAKIYNCTAYYGKWAGSILDIRSAFIIGKGLQLELIDKNKKAEKEWSEEWMEYNQLDKSAPLQYAVEGEIEGKFLGILIPEKVEKETYLIKFRYIPWTSKEYKVFANEKDYMKYERVTFSNTQKDTPLKEKDFIYIKFGGRINCPNEAVPNLWRCLPEIEDIARALKDTRHINHIFSHPTPYFQTSTPEEFKQMKENFLSKNFKIGKMFFGPAKFSFVAPDGKSIDSLEKEIMSKLKMVSGVTGIPVHFLGLPELMSNRSVADNLMQLIWASTRRPRESWAELYTRALRKSMILSNEKNKTNLDPMAVKMKIPEITADEWKYLDQYLKLYLEGALSLESLLSKIPEVEAEAELEKLNAIEEEEAEKIKQSIDDEKDFNDNKNDIVKE